MTCHYSNGSGFVSDSARACERRVLERIAGRWNHVTPRLRDGRRDGKQQHCGSVALMFRNSPSTLAAAAAFFSRRGFLPAATLVFGQSVMT